MKPSRRIFSLVQGPPEGVPLRSPLPDTFAERRGAFAWKHPVLNFLAIVAILFVGILCLLLWVLG